MPELPEIETICCGLKPHLEGRRILSVNVVERRLRCLVDRRLAERLKGKTILQIGRRAKYILISLSCDMVWMIHLGMSGKLIRVDPRTPKQKHDHIVVSLDSGQELRYHDPRRFGLSLVVAENELHELQVYDPDGQKGRLCPSPIKRVAIGNRSAFYCPSCQK